MTLKNVPTQRKSRNSSEYWDEMDRKEQSMKTSSSLKIYMALGTGLLAAGQEQKLRPAEVPAAVTEAAAKRYPKAQIAGWSKEVEDGKTTYEASIADRSKRDVVFAEDGSLVAVEEAIRISSLPAEVKRTLETKYPGAVVAKAEKIYHGDEIQYEVALRKTSKKEILLTSAGKVLKEE